jgi:protein-L-isoaspartate(D-aspartate) O-methyltransferase
MLCAEPGDQVLEIGTGTGYNAALLAHIVGAEGRVTSVEIDRDVAVGARRALLAAGSPARVVVGDGHAGWRAAAPVDAAVVTASTEVVPRAWFDQLRPGGRLVVPLRLSPVVFGVQAVAALRKARHGFDSAAVTCGGFMGLRGAGGHGRPARVAASEVADARRDRPLVELAGPALAGLAAAERQRLVVTALGFGRRRAVELGRASAWSLVAYVALALPEERLVEVTRPGTAATHQQSQRALGVVDALDSSLAVLVPTDGGARLEAFGGNGAERAMLSAIDRWSLAGRPRVDGATITVRYGAVRPHGWRSVRRGDQWIAFDWRRPGGL